MFDDVSNENPTIVKVNLIYSLVFLLFAGSMLYYAYGVMGLSDSKTSFADVCIYILSAGMIVLVLHPLLLYGNNEGDDTDSFVSIAAITIFGQAAVFGTAILMFYLQSGNGESLNIDPIPDEQLLILLVIAIANLIGLVINMVTLRSSDVQSWAGWDSYNVKKKTAIWKVILSMFLPLVILLAVFYVFAKVLGGTAIETMADDTWYCPTCCIKVPRNRSCPKCGRWQRWEMFQEMRLSAIMAE